MEQSTAHVAVLGVGLMGSRMARNLLAAGFPVIAWNRDRTKAESLVAQGATVAATPAEAASRGVVIVTMLANGPVVESVLFGTEGAAEAVSPGALVIDMSSAPPELARDHARRFAARGIAYLDAPVSGGTVGAEQGNLAIMVGGDHAAFERAAPVFAPLGRATLVGPAGSGQIAKLANQAIVAVTIGAVAEALLMAAMGGADPAAVRDAIMGGFADSRVLTLHGKRMILRDFIPGGPADHQVKDCATIVATAQAAGLTLPFAETALALFRDLVAHGGGRYDHSALLLELERRNPPARLGIAPDRLPA
ncbi:MAG: NAD(P)-dependent oxidoreductase [Alphaproteobacteria bacterium]|nr:NAD(P)-dependent oxidoreductase [Alphaproteobacteria bacterium]